MRHDLLARPITTQRMRGSEMKEIKAYIREDKMADVVRGLRRTGAGPITVVRVVPVGSDVEPAFVDISPAAPVAHYAPMLKIELVCEDGAVNRFADTIREQARTGQRGDGIIFISDVQRALHIRSGNQDEAAL
jgi:nitrogen regulatory protein P-II 1